MDKRKALKLMMDKIQFCNMSLLNLYNFYVEITAKGYVVYFSKPYEKDNLINGLQFYFNTIRR